MTTVRPEPVADWAAHIARLRRPDDLVSRADRIYPAYVCALVLGYVLISVGYRETPQVTPAVVDGRAAVGPYLALVVAGVVCAAVAAAIDGGPVVLDPADAVVLLGWPVPRAQLVRRALRRAYLRGAVVGGALGAVITLGVVRNLALSFAQVWPTTLLLPAVVGVLAVAIGWLGQARDWGRHTSRCEPALFVAMTAALVFGVRRDVDLRSVAAGRWSPLRPVTSALSIDATPALQWVLVTVVAVVTGGLVGAGRRRMSTITAEQLRSRSRRASVLAAAAFVLDTAGIYLHRTQPGRVRRRRRQHLPTRGITTSLVSKAFVQAQGGALAARIPIGAAVICVVAEVARGLSDVGTEEGLQRAALVGLLLAAIGSRWADPVRLDAAAPQASGGLPVTRDELVACDVVGAWICWLPAAVLAGAATLAAGRPAYAGGVLLFGVALGVAVAGLSSAYATVELPVVVGTGVDAAQAAGRLVPWLLAMVLASWPIGVAGLTPPAVVASMALLVAAGWRATVQSARLARNLL